MKLTTFIVFVFAFAAQAQGTAGYRSITPLEAKNYNENANACCFLDWGVSGWLSQDREFPDAEVIDTKTGKKVTIRELVKDRPIVLEMGSVTCPSYDLNLPRMKELAKKYEGKVDFHTLYVRENHPNDMYKIHTSMDQKIRYAKDLAKLSKLESAVLVDDVNGTLHQALGNFGNAVFVVGKDMRTNHWSIFSHPTLLERGIESLLKANGIAAKAKFVGGTDVHPLAQKEIAAEEKKKTLARMVERGEKPSSYTLSKLTTTYEKLNPPTKQMFDKMATPSKEGIFEFIKGAASDLDPKEPRSKNPMLDMQLGFRTEYQRRYEEWKKLNAIQDKIDVANEQLKEPR